MDGKSAAVWVEGRFVGNFEVPAGAHGAISMQSPVRVKVRHAGVTQPGDPRMVPIDMNSYANDHFSVPLEPQAGAPSHIKAGDIEFQLPPGPQNQVNLRGAQWTEWKTDGTPWAGENYDSGSPIAFDPRMPMLRVPAVDYIAAHVLAVADDDPKLTSKLTLRAGRSAGGNSLAIQYDFAAAVPRRSQLDARGVGVSPAQAGETPAPQVEVVTTPAGRLAHVVLPIGRAIAQDLRLPGPHDGDPRGAMDMELTKEIRLTIRAPEANRCRYRPLGLSSGVRIAALTLEKAPSQMRDQQRRGGQCLRRAARSRPSRCNLQTSPTGPSPTRSSRGPGIWTARPPRSGPTAAWRRARRPRCRWSCPYPSGAITTWTSRWLTPPGASWCGEPVSPCLPPDSRKHRDQSPFGTYDFGGGHFTPYKADQCGSLFVKAGLRYGMFGFPAEDLNKYGILRGIEPNIMGAPQWRLSGTACWRKALEVTPNVPPLALVFHEMTISGDHCTRVPDLFTDRTYKLNEEEQQSFRQMIGHRP